MRRMTKTCACNNDQSCLTLEYIKLFLYTIAAGFYNRGKGGGRMVIGVQKTSQIMREHIDLEL